MGDIVERLRDGGVFPMTFGGPDVKDVAILYDPMTPTDAIKEIERLRVMLHSDSLLGLRADNARLRAALLEIRENIMVASVCRAYLDPIDEIALRALEAKDD